MDKKKGTRRTRVRHIRVTDGEAKPMPFYERWLHWITGRCLLALSIMAAKRRDWHEFNHLNAALIGGNSFHNDARPCGFPHEAWHMPLRFQGGAVASPVKDGDDLP